MAKQEPALELVSAKDVKVRPVKWLWPFLIHLYAHTCCLYDKR